MCVFDLWAMAGQVFFFFVGDENPPLANSQIPAKHSAEDESAKALNHKAKRTLIEI